MTATDLLGGRVILHAGDCLDVMAALPENSVDACVTDGPYFLPSISNRFGSETAAVAQGRIFQGSQAGFIGKPSITSDICTKPELWAAVLRILKPGGHLLSFAATKGFGRMQVAAEDAGFETRDMLVWLYGTGFPKGKPLGKFMDRHYLGDHLDDDELARGPVSHSAAFYDERDIVLKPAIEPILLARKPLIGTISDNLAAFGTGSLDVTGCRVEHGTGSSYPSNVLLDGSGEVIAAFPRDADGRSAARFFYSAKADAFDRAGSNHPTVKPVSLMQYLVRLVTAPGQIVIDPFAGTGTTGEAAWREGRRALLIEIDADFQTDIVRRHALAVAGPEERRRESIKAKVGEKPFEAGSLFASL